MIERYSRPEMKKVWSEESKFDRWLRVEISVCQAWAEEGVIPQEMVPNIERAHYDLKRINELLSITHHDMTAFTGAVCESLGEEGRFIHLGLTSSDVMDTALSLQLMEAESILDHDMQELIQVLEQKAREYKRIPMIGRTHGIHAEPTTFGLKLLLWAQEMKRNAQRLFQAREAISYGKISGAVGNYATVPPGVEERSLKRLGLSPAPISSQILQRDRHAQFVTTLALSMSSLEKFALGLRGLQQTEVSEVSEPFSSGQTGSSAMPHKKNPELCERICGLARLVRGYALTSLENVALWQERDISHSSAERIILPDSCLATDYALSLFTEVMKGLEVYPEQMRRNIDLTQGLIFSQRVLLALIQKGLSREEAYRLVQQHALRAGKEGKSLLDLLRSDGEIGSYLSSPELAKLFDVEFYLRYVDEIFARCSS